MHGFVLIISYCLQKTAWVSISSGFSGEWYPKDIYFFKGGGVSKTFLQYLLLVNFDF